MPVIHGQIAVALYADDLPVVAAGLHEILNVVIQSPSSCTLQVRIGRCGQVTLCGQLKEITNSGHTVWVTHPGGRDTIALNPRPVLKTWGDRKKHLLSWLQYQEAKIETFASSHIVSLGFWILTRLQIPGASPAIL